MGLYDFTVKDEQGRDVPLSDYKGKVLLIVNTVAGCGFSLQYEQLQRLYEGYREKGFEILDFPGYQYKEEELEKDMSPEELESVRKPRTGVAFRQFAKIQVSGPGASPLYTYLQHEKKPLFHSRIDNFTKFLIGKTGDVVRRYPPGVKPSQIEKDLKKLLEE